MLISSREGVDRQQLMFEANWEIWFGWESWNSVRLLVSIAHHSSILAQQSIQKNPSNEWFMFITNYSFFSGHCSKMKTNTRLLCK